MLDQLIEALQYGFIQRALLAGSIIAFCCAFLGIFLILRRFAMIGEGLAHFSFGSIGLALMLGLYPMGLMIPLAVLASLLIYTLSEKSVYGDAAIGMISAVGIAGGVLLASIGGGFNIDLFSYLFGDILTIKPLEVAIALILSAVVIIMTLFFYQELFTITFDADYARVLGLNPARLEKVLLVLTALTVALGIKVVGTMLVSSLIIFPAVTALQLARSFKGALLIGATLGVLSVILGILIAYLLDLPAGAAIVLFNAVTFALACTAARLFKL